MSPIARLLLIAALLVPSLAAAPGAPALTPPSAARPSTDSILQGLGGVPCPDDSEFTCVTIDMPLDHFSPADTRTIPVTFAVLPASGNNNNRKGMFVTATGGPGASGIAAADSYTSVFDRSITRRFDIVFFDQRGVALSGGLTCPNAAAAFYLADFRAGTPAQEAALKQAAQTFSQACVSEMGNPEALPYLGTAQAVEDLEAFRQIMQDEEFWLYGESYGTQYVQTYAAAHGEHLAGLMVDGTVDLTLSLFEFYEQQAQAFNDTLVATLAVCDADPACAEDMGDPGAAAYDDLAERLDQRERPFRFPLPTDDDPRRHFAFGDLETAAAGQMYTEDDRMLFTRALAAYADRGDLAPLARLLYLSLGVDPETLAAIPDPSWSDGIFYSVECQDYGHAGATPDERAENYLNAGDPVEASVPRLASIFYGDLPCAYWPNVNTDPARPAPLAAEGIPTLVLGATADPATPYGNGVSVYQALDDGYLISQEGGPHIIFGRGNACPDDLVTDFLVRDRVPPQRETTCEGMVADEYVPLAPRSASAFADQLEALSSADTEINYLPEYYYWDGVEPSGAGCAYGGTLHFEPDGDKYAFTLDKCAFTRQFIMTGMGEYNPSNDRMVLDVTTKGRWECELKYVRTGDNYRVTGMCEGKKINLNA